MAGAKPAVRLLASFLQSLQDKLAVIFMSEGQVPHSVLYLLQSFLLHQAGYLPLIVLLSLSKLFSFFFTDNLRFHCCPAPQNFHIDVVTVWNIHSITIWPNVRIITKMLKNIQDVNVISSRVSHTPTEVSKWPRHHYLLRKISSMLQPFLGSSVSPFSSWLS